MLKLEVLRAKKGDCLLLRYGDDNSLRTALIDGGPGGVWKSFLKPRLDQLRAAAAPDRLHIDLLIVSHIDDDHINGLIQMTQLLKEQLGKEDLYLDVDLLWHNSFDDIFGEVGASVSADGEDVEAAAVDALSDEYEISEAGALTLLSVGQGQTLRDNAAALGWLVNSPFDELVKAGTDDSVVKLKGGLTLTVLGPAEDRLEAFQQEWDKELKEQQDKAKTAQYLDKSVPNLASIVLLVEAAERRLLLTGDGRGDDIIDNAKAAQVLDAKGQLEVDVLKVPHHGSIRNVELDFFQTFPARHYVISGDGSHGNPRLETFELLFESRTDPADRFDIYLTYDPDDFRPQHKSNEPDVPYPAADLKKLFADQKAAGVDFDVSWPDNDEPSLTIELA